MSQQSTFAPEPRKVMEAIRMEAAADLQAGMSQAKVARKYARSRTTVSRWARLLSEQGTIGLRQRHGGGRPCFLTPENWIVLTKAYASARDSGVRWTYLDVKYFILAKFDHGYHEDHCSRLLVKLRENYL